MSWIWDVPYRTKDHRPYRKTDLETAESQVRPEESQARFSLRCSFQQLSSATWRRCGSLRRSLRARPWNKAPG